MEKAAVYARYSSHTQTEQSIEGQLAAAQKYAAEHDYSIVAEYCDRAKTGTNDNREEFQRMLSDTAKHAFSVIIVWKVDRFGRNREEITFNKYKCKKNGVRVEYIAENISVGPEGVILESVLEGMAEYYSLQLSQNIRRGQLESAKKCHPVNGSMPLGYNRAADGGYEIDPVEAEAVKEIFSHIASVMSLAETTRWLNEHGYRTSRGREFTKNSLPRILDNELYIGNYKYKDLVYAENVVPAIISRDLWDKARTESSIVARKASGNWHYSDYLLTGKLVCGLCGAPMSGQSGTSKTGKIHNYYVCRGAKHGSCAQKRIRQDLMEKKILSCVFDAIFNEENLENIIDKTWEYYCSNNDSSDETKRLKQTIEGINRQEKNIIRAVESGMDYELVRERLLELKEQRISLEVALGKLQVTSPLKLTKEHIRYFLSQFQQEKYSDVKLQKRLIDTFVNSIRVDADTITVAFNYSSDGTKYNVSSPVCTQMELSTRGANIIVDRNVFLVVVAHP